MTVAMSTGAKEAIVVLVALLWFIVPAVLTDRIGERPLLGQPRERMRYESEDVDSHSESAKPGATTIRPLSTSTFRTQDSTSGSDRPESSSRTSFAG